VCPVLLRSEIAEKALDGVNAHRGIEGAAITGILAGVVADPAMHGRHGVVGHQSVPGLAVLARLREREPRLDILARRTSVIARREKIYIDRTPRAGRAGRISPGQVYGGRHISRLDAHV